MVTQLPACLESRRLLDGDPPYTPPNTAPYESDAGWAYYVMAGETSVSGSVSGYWSDNEYDTITFSSVVSGLNMQPNGSFVYTPVGGMFSYFESMDISYEATDGENSTPGKIRLGFFPAEVTVTTAGGTAEAKNPDNIAAAYFVISRTGNTNSALTVNFSLAGAILNTDYTSTATSSITIPAGSPSANVTIKALDNHVADNSRFVTLTIQDSVEYMAFDPDDSIGIGDNDRWNWIVPTMLEASFQDQTIKTIDSNNRLVTEISGDFTPGMDLNAGFNAHAWVQHQYRSGSDDLFATYGEWEAVEAWSADYTGSFECDPMTGEITETSRSRTATAVPVGLSIDDSVFDFVISGHTVTAKIEVKATKSISVTGIGPIGNQPITTTLYKADAKINESLKTKLWEY